MGKGNNDGSEIPDRRGPSDNYIQPPFREKRRESYIFNT